MSAIAELISVENEQVLPLDRCVSHAAAERHVFVVCNGDSCREAGSKRLLGLLQSECAHRRDSQDIRISSSKCLGRCGTAPAMVKNGRLLGWMSPRRLKFELQRLGLLPATSH